MYKLFYPEGERINRPNIEKWTQILDKKFKLLKANPVMQNDWYLDLLLLTNQTSLVALYLGLNELAHDICCLTINFFFQLDEQNKIKHVQYTLQPHINLARLQIVHGNFAQAHTYLDQIAPDLNHFIINNNRFERSQLDDFQNDLLTNCYFFEKLKILSNEPLGVLEDFVRRYHKDYVQFQFLFLEGQVLSFKKKKLYLQAQNLIHTNLSALNENVVPYFLLHLIDINYGLNSNTDQLHLALEELIDHQMACLQDIGLHDFSFVFEIFKRVKLIFGKEGLLLFEAQFKTFLNLLRPMEDEILLIQTLNLGMQAWPALYDEFIELITQTQYMFLKKDFLTTTNLNGFNNNWQLGNELCRFLKTNPFKIN